MTIPSRYINFPASEFHQRYAIAQQKMATRGLDAIMVTNQHNYIYYTGHLTTGTVPHWLWGMTNARPSIAVLPRKQDPFLIYSYIGEDIFSNPYQQRNGPYLEAQGQGPCWIPQRKVYCAEPFAADYLIDAFNEAGFTKGVVGCEFGDEQRFCFPLRDFYALQKAFPDIEWVDASDMFWQMRAKKSPLEADRMREANRITVAVQDRFCKMAHVGMNTHDAERLLHNLALEEGADCMPLCVYWVTGPNGCYEYPPTGRQFEKGDLLYLDLGAQYQGYLADVNRMAHIGEPPDVVKRYFAIMVELSQFLIEQIRPGAAVKDIWAALREQYRRHGLPMRPNREGHGLGMLSAEWPSLIGDTDLVLEPGMTITSEPAFPTPEGYYFSIEHTIWVTETGAENLTPAPMELLIIKD